MNAIALGLVLVSALAWIHLAVARGGFWRCRVTDDAQHATLARRDPRVPWPPVTAVIPARNEADLVGATVASLLGGAYHGRLSVVVVDDHSDDATAAIAREAARACGAADRLTVLAAPLLPSGWTGKLWALSHGIAHVDASPDAPQHLLLTDADIRYGRDAVSALVASAVESRAVLSSLMVRLRCESLVERALIPAFVFFFQMLYPFAWVNRSARRIAAAAGGCMLVDRAVLRDAGGLAAIRHALIDDCALARLLKPHGPISLALGTCVESLRPYRAFDDVRRMVVRSAYAQLSFSPWRLALVVVLITIVFVVPVAALGVDDARVRAVGFLTWLLMAFLFMPILRRDRVARTWAFALPAIAAIYLAFTVESAWQHRRGRGGLWKGRVSASAASPS